jgi:hypothetical protein
MKTTRINWGGWIILLSCLALIGLISATTVSLTKREANQVAHSYVPKMVAISLANKSLSQAFNETLQAVLATEAGTRRELITSVSHQSEKTTTHLHEYTRLVADAEERRQLELLLAARREYFSVRDLVFAFLASGNDAKALSVYHESLRPAFTAYEKESLALLQRNAADAVEKSASVVNRALILQIMVALFSATLFLLGFGLGLFSGIHSGKTR